MDPFKDEQSYRKSVQEIYTRIESAFESVDPDIAECTQSLGSLIITLGGSSKIILSSQPSVKQIWLAIAAKGKAVHFVYDPGSARWLDDKGRGIELLTELSNTLGEAAKLNLRF